MLSKMPPHPRAHCYQQLEAHHFPLSQGTRDDMGEAEGGIISQTQTWASDEEGELREEYFPVVQVSKDPDQSMLQERFSITQRLGF